MPSPPPHCKSRHEKREIRKGLLSLRNFSVWQSNSKEASRTNNEHSIFEFNFVISTHTHWPMFETQEAWKEALLPN